MISATTWIVVADGARARIAESRGTREMLQSALTCDFAAPHAPTQALVSDRPGRYRPGRHGEHAPGRRHAVQPRTDRHQFEKALFARHLSGVLEDAARSRRFNRLVLIAPPAALGRLRAVLGPRARTMLAAEIGKDLTHCPLFGLKRWVRPVLRPRSRAHGLPPRT